MKVLVTGATGFVGARFVRHLLMKGDEVHIIARTPSNLGRLQDVADRIMVHEADLTSATLLTEVVSKIPLGRIFHFANQGVHAGDSIPAERFHEVNTQGLANLLEALRPLTYEAFVNVGSSSEYGLTDAPMRESDVCTPVSAYGISKLKATALATAEANEHGKPVATFRIFSPYGPEDDARRLIPTVVRSLKDGSAFMRPHPDAKRDYIYVDDIVELLYDAASVLKEHAGEVFNVGRGEELRADVVVAEIARLMGKSIDGVPQAAILAPTEPARWVADMTKTFAAFSWRPTTSLEEGLTRTITAYA